MRWLDKLLRRDYEGRHQAADRMPMTPPPSAPSTDTLRAAAAAQEAAERLRESQARRPKVEAQAKATARITRENGFAELIRNALGSGP